MEAGFSQIYTYFSAAGIIEVIKETVIVQQHMQELWKASTNPPIIVT